MSNFGTNQWGGNMESFSICLNRSYDHYIPCETILKIEKVLSRSWDKDLVSQLTNCQKTKLFVKYDGPEYLNVTLWNKVKPDVQGVISLSIVDADDLKQCLLPQQFIDFDFYSKEFEYRLDLQQLQKNPKLLRNEDLWLHCEIATKEQFKIPTMQEIANNLKFRLPVNVSEDNPVAFLLKIEKFSDVIIVIGEKEIKAHKAFLTMRSPVFAAMFENEMKEQKQNRVVISDMDYETVQQMLLYIYTGKTPNLSDMADRLLKAAEKYSLDALKIICQKQLSSTISMDTVMQLMALADLYNANLLKDKLNEFITKNFEALMDKPSWQKLLYEASSKQYLNKES